MVDILKGCRVGYSRISWGQLTGHVLVFLGHSVSEMSILKVMFAQLILGVM